MQLNGSQIFVEVLCEQGVDTLFGYPGGAVLNLYDELYKNADRITHVLTAHEQGAAHAADGYARATGRTGVVLATSGPGATNLVTGIATAYMDSVPMVAFTGNIPTAGLGTDGFQEAYIEGITMPITKHNFTVRKVEDLADTMRAAFRIAQSGRKGPVLVDIPKDVTAAVCEFTPKQPEKIRTVTTYNAEQVKWAADIINAAERPLVYFGGGVRSAFWRQMLADVYGCPIQTAKAALEGPALGVAILAGVGTGVYPSVESACDAIVKPDTVLYPDAERSRAYEPYYRLYLRQYPALRETFHALAAMRSRA